MESPPDLRGLARIPTLKPERKPLKYPEKVTTSFVHVGRHRPSVLKNEKVKYLTYDGSFLGRLDWHQTVTWWEPQPFDSKPTVMYAMFMFNGHEYPVILKKNSAQKRDQLIIDEIKPLFGLKKMGTHSVKLSGIPHVLPRGRLHVEDKWSYYFVFRATTFLDRNNQIMFQQLTPLSKFNWFPEPGEEPDQNHRDFYDEVQRIFIFRDIVRVVRTTLDDILVRTDPLTLYSISETSVRPPNEACTPLSLARGQLQAKLVESYFPEPRNRAETIIRMLGLTSSNYPERLDRLRYAISEIIFRIDNNKIWLVDQIINRLTDDLQVFYSIEAESNKLSEAESHRSFDEAMEFALEKSMGQSMNLLLFGED
jgi:hypothetical protein